MSVRTKAILVVGVITAAAGFLRLDGLGQPSRKVFDEIYYASDGCWSAGYDYRDCGLDADVERSWVHPPLGKTMVGWGIDAFGNGAFGWRFSAAVAGTLTVALAGALAFLLTTSWLWAGVGALLVGTEHLLFVQSRIAMLDVFLAMFVVLGFVLLVWDRRRNLEVEEPPPVEVPEPEPVPVPTRDDAWLDEPPEAHGPLVGVPAARSSPAEASVAVKLPGLVRPLRVLAGAAFGAAIAVKWSGGLALLAALLLAVGWERSHRRSIGKRRPLGRALVDQWPGLLLAFVMVPLLVYLAAWGPWLSNRDYDLGALVGHHAEMADYHRTLSTENEEGEPIHPYMSRASTWLLLGRPVVYHFDAEQWGEPGATAHEIIAIGNPVIFWGSLLVIPTLLLVWILRRRWQAGVVVAAVLVQYLPWLAVTRPLFLFYMTPVTPFLALGVTLILRDLADVRLGGRRALAPLAAAGVLASVAAFVFFWPVLTAETVSTEAWQMRMWFSGWV
jgi:dolichyl-phosphate-mannose--protein O-mannosyl transferase